MESAEGVGAGFGPSSSEISERRAAARAARSEAESTSSLASNRLHCREARTCDFTKLRRKRVSTNQDIVQYRVVVLGGRFHWGAVVEVK